MCLSQAQLSTKMQVLPPNINTENKITHQKLKDTMIKFKLSFFVFISLFSATCLSQDVTKAKEVRNILSIAAGGTSTTLGITYERILSSRKVSLEIGTGLLLGGGLGMNFYFSKPINASLLAFKFEKSLHNCFILAILKAYIIACFI